MERAGERAKRGNIAIKVTQLKQKIFSGQVCTKWRGRGRGRRNPKPETHWNLSSTQYEEGECGEGVVEKKIAKLKNKRQNWATLLLVNTLSQKSTNIKNFEAREAAFQFFSSAQKNFWQSPPPNSLCPAPTETTPTAVRSGNKNNSNNKQNDDRNRHWAGEAGGWVGWAPHGAIASPAATPGDVWTLDGWALDQCWLERKEGRGVGEWQANWQLCLAKIDYFTRRSLRVLAFFKLLIMANRH